MDRPPRGRATQSKATQPPHRMRWPSGSEGDHAVRAFTAGIKGRARRAAVAHHREIEDMIEGDLLTTGPAEPRHFAHCCAAHTHELGQSLAVGMFGRPDIFRYLGARRRTRGSQWVSTQFTRIRRARLGARRSRLRARISRRACSNASSRARAAHAVGMLL